tara:strand:+ start:277 stop:594 length:318 start_codon:yes stop_codon:yes gene_type:complete
MAQQPSEVFVWCLDDLDPNGNLLKVAPPTELAQTGLLVGQPWARVWHNYAFNNTGAYTKFIDEEILKVGGCVTFRTSLAPDFTEWVGTWSVAYVNGDFTTYERTA